MISGGATTDPIDVPLLKIAIPSARCRTGNHSAITFAAPGQLPASPNPNRKRKHCKLKSPVASACAILARLHTIIEIVNPRRFPTRSYSRPESAWLSVYATRNAFVIPANCRLDKCNCSVMTGASTEIVSRFTKLISVARKISPAIHHRSPAIPFVFKRLL